MTAIDGDGGREPPEREWECANERTVEWNREQWAHLMARRASVDPTVLALQAALDANPADWPLRGVLADRLEELGDEIAAAGQRWQAKFEKHPLFDRHQELYPHWLEGGGGWLWFMNPYGERYHANLGPLVCNFLLGSTALYRNEAGWQYPDRQAAEADLAQSIHALRQ
jgi:hypothetical protein